MDSIEHGSFATQHTSALRKSHGTFLVPTLTVFEVFYKVASEHAELLSPAAALFAATRNAAELLYALGAFDAAGEFAEALGFGGDARRERQNPPELHAVQAIFSQLTKAEAIHNAHAKIRLL